MSWYPGDTLLLIEDALIPVIDLFAGPGGLNEGFSSIPTKDGSPAFTTLASFEMDELACQTLRLRATYRHLKTTGGDLGPYYRYIQGLQSWPDTMKGSFKKAYELASEHVVRAELGIGERPRVDAHIQKLLGPEHQRSQWVLIGGPPCQAYSLAGRSRRTGDKHFESDLKHFLYREYLHIVSKFKPSIFVMENVKGLLSATNGGQGMLKRILSDLENLPSGVQYEIRSLTVTTAPGEKPQPQDFVIHSEDYGIPQKRHRVILLGIRSDLVDIAPQRVLVKSKRRLTVRDAISDLPRVQSKISARKPKNETVDWDAELVAARRTGAEAFQVHTMPATNDKSGNELRDWLLEDAPRQVIQHEPRAHMISDLVRYYLLSAKALELGRSPKYADLEEKFLPDHLNIDKANTPFVDRFKVQVWDEPSTTVVSHISKDGHYYIHPNPKQGRSLTVREAARLQTFPDNYFFEGPRTQQFHQVGNAVPPLLARKIGRQVLVMLEAIAETSNTPE